MPTPRSIRRAPAILGAIALAGAAIASDPESQWLHYGNDPGGTRSSSLADINASNVDRLAIAWEYHTGDNVQAMAMGWKTAFEATPLVADGVMYLSTPTSRVIALDALTGEHRWTHDPEIPQEWRYGELTSRGVCLWQDPDSGERRVFFGTLDGRLLALDAASGTLIEAFGDAGVIDLRQGIDVVGDGTYGVTSPPVVASGLVVVGSSIKDNQRVEQERGVVRAFDVRTGALAWSWDPIPRNPGDPGWDAWPDPEQARRTGGANAWAPMSVDHERGLVFVPTGSASPDYYGGLRLGTNLFANCVVALRAATGEIAWHFQLVRHDLWDYDTAAQPTLATIEIDGRRRDVVVQAGKMGHVFVLDRDTGEPVFPVEERPVPASDVEGERAWPTQPFPTKPPPLASPTLDADHLWALTPAERKAGLDALASFRWEGTFTPPSVAGTIAFPGDLGGINWGGLAVDQVQGMMVVNVVHVPFVARLIPRDEFEDIDEATQNKNRRYVGPQAGAPFGIERGPLLTKLGAPIVAPPWGELIGVDLGTGDVAWRTPLGTLADALPIPLPLPTGTPSRGGPLITAGGLVFIGAAADNFIRAFDLDTGEELWKHRLPAGGQATPMTFRAADGRQFLVICAGGHGKIGTTTGDSVIAFALPAD